MSDQDISKLLEEIKRRILSVSSPERIVLFGSYAREQQHADSDVDLLVIEKDVKAPRAESVRIRRALRGLMVPIDVLAATPEQVERHRDSPGLVYGPALREGRVIYDRATSS